jgi:uncharacterized protein (DUF58 family)
MDINARLKRLKIQSEKLVDTFFSGDYSSLFKGPGLEFYETRPYVAGDDIRFIDWHVTGRLNAPYCKVFKEERELILTIVLDVSASMYGEFSTAKSRMAEEIFSLLSFAAISNGDRVGCIAFSEMIEYQSPAKRGNRHILSQIKNILSIKPKMLGSDIPYALRTVGEVMKRRGICIIISDFKAENYWRELSMLARRHDVVAIRIESDSDNFLPAKGYLSLVDPEEGATLSFMPTGKRFEHEYTGFWESTRTAWRKNCGKRGVDTLIINTNHDAQKKLLAFFRRRGDN